MSDDDTNLQEQLASVRQERDDLQERVDDLEEQLSDTEDTLDDRDDEIEQLRDEIGPFKELLASIVADDSPLDSETVAERFALSELVDQLAPDQDEDDENYTEVVREQLAESLAPRGEGEDDGDSGGANQPTDDSDQLARSVLDLTDVRDMNEMGETPTEYLARSYGVDATEYDDERQLRRAVTTNGGEN